MSTFAFCIFILACLKPSQQQLFLEKKVAASTESPIWRRLELDTTSFPIIEAFLTQLGDWAFWVAMILFIGMAFLLWKEGRIHHGYNQEIIYLLFGLVILGSFYSIPFIFLFGCICFWDKIKILFESAKPQDKPVSFIENGIEMKTPLLPIKEEYAKKAFLRDPLKEQKKRASPFDQYSENPRKAYSKNPLEPPSKKGGAKVAKGFIQKLCECFSKNSKGLVKKAGTIAEQHKDQIMSVSKEWAAQGMQIGKQHLHNLTSPIQISGEGLKPETVKLSRQHETPLERKENENLKNIPRVASRDFDKFVFKGEWLPLKGENNTTHYELRLFSINRYIKKLREMRMRRERNQDHSEEEEIRAENEANKMEEQQEAEIITNPSPIFTLPPKNFVDLSRIETKPLEFTWNRDYYMNLLFENQENPMDEEIPEKEEDGDEYQFGDEAAYSWLNNFRKK